MGVTGRDSTALQTDRAIGIARRLPRDKRLFLFVNVSAIHQPSTMFLPGATAESVDTQVAALAYADPHLGSLVHSLRRRAPLLLIVCSDHGTAFGEEGHHGHRHAHPVIWTVPYAEALLPQTGGAA
jgi:hypothetical protein